MFSGAKKYGTNIILLKVHYNGLVTILELKQLSGLCIVQTIQAYNTVTNLQYCTYLCISCLKIYTLKFCQKQLGYFSRFYILFHIKLYYPVVFAGHLPLYAGKLGSNCLINKEIIHTEGKASYNGLICCSLQLHFLAAGTLHHQF